MDLKTDSKNLLCKAGKPKFIYALVDPRDQKTYYVGASVNPNSRFFCHLTNIKTRTSNDARIDWLESLQKQDLKPTLKILQKVAEDEWEHFEMKWISKLRKQGEPLVNRTDGGRGNKGFTPPEDLRKRWSEQRKGMYSAETHPDWCRNISISHASNLPRRKGKNKYRGVTYRPDRGGKYQVRICFGRRCVYSEYFSTDIEAAKARDKKALELFGPTAYLNFPLESE